MRFVAPEAEKENLKEHLKPGRVIVTSQPGAVVILPKPQPYACRNRNPMGPDCQYTHQHPDDPKCAGCWWHKANVNDSR